MNIKINRMTLIAELEAVLTTKEAELAQSNKDNEKWEKANNEWEKAVEKAIRKGIGHVSDIREGYSYYDDQISVTIRIHKSDVQPKPERTQNTYELNQDCEELRHSIKLLRMSDQENVPATVYKQVLRFL